MNYCKEEEERNPHMYEGYFDDHDKMSAHLHYAIESIDLHTPEEFKQWLASILENYGT
jgi:hypothetical protein